MSIQSEFEMTLSNLDLGGVKADGLKSIILRLSASAGQCLELLGIPVTAAVCTSEC